MHIRPCYYICPATVRVNMMGPGDIQVTNPNLIEARVYNAIFTAVISVFKAFINIFQIFFYPISAHAQRLQTSMPFAGAYCYC